MTRSRTPETLLSEILAPPSRPADHGFAARVRLAVLEEQRYRAARKAAFERLGSDLLILIGLAGAAVGIARAAALTVPLPGSSPVLLVAILAVGGWIALSGEARRLRFA